MGYLNVKLKPKQNLSHAIYVMKHLLIWTAWSLTKNNMDSQRDVRKIQSLKVMKRTKKTEFINISSTGCDIYSDASFTMSGHGEYRHLYRELN